MLSLAEKAWLAGFMDADGSICLTRGFKNVKKDQHSLIPKITFHNTCVLSLNRIAALVVKAGIPLKTSARKRTAITHANMANVHIDGMKRARVILELLEPYLITKKLEAQIMLKFIERRKTLGVRNKPYEPVDYLAYEALKYLKKTRHLRDYMPTVGEVLNEDIVRTAAKAVEVAEMSTRLSQEERNEFASKLVWYRKDRSQGRPSPK